jgi:cold-inducible RNA-binding protein
MAMKLFVGGIPYSSTQDALSAAFGQAGTVVSCQIIIDKFTGRSKGFGFIEMSNDEEAKAAIEMWNGREFEGRKLVVNEARPMTERPPRRDFGGNGGGRRDFHGGDRGGFRGGRDDDRGGRDW